jgi:hypothetical protein
MSVFQDIDSALDSHLNDLPDKPPVAWENKGYAPVLGTLYLRPKNLTGDSRQATLGTSGTDENNGVYQIDVFAESGEGKYEALEKADEIADHFKRGTLLTYNDRSVRIRSVSRREGNNTDSGWYKVSIEIVYIIFTEARD